MHKVQEFLLLLMTDLDEDVEVYDLSMDILYFLITIVHFFSYLLNSAH
jgi:hypothetical protein